MILLFNLQIPLPTLLSPLVHDGTTHSLTPLVTHTPEYTTVLSLTLSFPGGWASGPGSKGLVSGDTENLPSKKNVQRRTSVRVATNAGWLSGPLSGLRAAQRTANDGLKM
jgi:hypothetical protein